MCKPEVRFFAPKTNKMRIEYLTKATFVDGTVRYINNDEEVLFADQVIKLEVIGTQGDTRERQYKNVDKEELQQLKEKDLALQALFHDCNFTIDGNWVEVIIPFHECDNN